MSRGAVRVAVGIFFLAYLVGVTYPGVLPFNRIRPMILGIPFSFAWVVVWIVLAGLALWWLDRSEMRARDRR